MTLTNKKRPVKKSKKIKHEKEKPKARPVVKKSKAKKGYSKYNNPKSKQLNAKEANKGDIIVGKLSDYEKLKNAVNHKRESVIVLKNGDKDLGVVYLHGLNAVDGKSRKNKEDKGIWKKVKKSDNQEVYLDLDIRTKDKNGKNIRQGEKFKNTGKKIPDMKSVEAHVFNKSKKSHSLRNILFLNREKRDKSQNKKKKQK